MTDHTVRVGEDELRVLKAALWCYIRVHLGQPEAAFEPLMEHLIGDDENPSFPFDMAVMRRRLENLGNDMTGVPNGGPGLYSENVSNKARLARKVLARLDGEFVVDGLIGADGESRPDRKS